MDGAQTVNFQLSMVDSEVSAEELGAVVRVVAAELESRGADVAAVASSRGGEPGRVAKGTGSGGSILNVEINLENIVAFGKWLRERLVGTSTKAKFEYKGRSLSLMVEMRRNWLLLWQDLRSLWR